MALDFRNVYGVIVSEKLDIKWQRLVYNDFRLIAMATSGKILIKGIKARGPRRLIRIEPWDAPDIKEWGTKNATSTGRVWADPIDKYRSQHIRAQIDFNTSTWYGKTGCCYLPGAASDQILFHEAVHAVRQLDSDFNTKALKGGMAGYDNEEEFFAVLITNIYASDPTNPRGAQSTLRADHSIAFNTLPAHFSGSYSFFQSSKQIYRLVKKFCDQHPNWSYDLAFIRSNFNPIGAYYYDKKKCEALSKASTIS